MIEVIEFIRNNWHFSEFVTFFYFYFSNLGFLNGVAVDFNIICIYYRGLVMRIKSNLLVQAC